MTDDDLLEAALAQERARRAAEPIDPRWDRVASGELSETEARRHLVRGPRDEALLEAFRPLDEGFRERILARVQRVGQPPARRSRPRTQRRSWVWRSAVAAAAAAAVLIAVRDSGMPPLPRYEAQLEGGEKLLRGSEPVEDRVVLRIGSRLDWYLRPATAVAGAVGVRTFVRGQGGFHAWPASVEVSPLGAVHVSYVLEAGALAPGRLELIVVVGRPGQLPDSEAALDEALSAGAGALYAARRDIEVLGAR